MKPDQLQRLAYRWSFKAAYLDKRGTAFQEWFVKIAGHAFGSDFEEVKPYGPQGDHKCDGLRRSLGMLFQCYAPDRFEDGKAVSKITSDLIGAINHWPGTMQAWTLVHNDRNGLSPGVTKCLTDLGVRHPKVVIAPWAETELHNLVMDLQVHQLEDLFGYAPSMPAFDSVGFAQLRPVIDAIQRRKPDPNAKLIPPSEHKIEHNKLSFEAADLLRHGRRKESRVQEYLDKMVRPDDAEEIAEAVRDQYRSLKDLDLDPDTIFGHLQRFIGWQGDPSRQAAALAVLCYFFDRCDIFEDLPPSEVV